MKVANIITHAIQQVGVFMPFGTYLELADAGGPSSSLCVVPYCVLIALCSVSVLVTVAIAVDRLTSLAQPLRYKNIITHSSIEKYIAVFWIYATAVGLSPFIYAKTFLGVGQAYGYVFFSFFFTVNCEISSVSVH